MPHLSLVPHDTCSSSAGGIHVVHAWEWSDNLIQYWMGNDVTDESTGKQRSTRLTYEEISSMRVRDLKRHLAHRHGYSHEELSKILDKKDLISNLLYEEDKLRSQQQSKQQRYHFWNLALTTVLAIVLVAGMPLWIQVMNVISVNFVVYTDRLTYGLSQCYQYRSSSAVIWFICLLLLDLCQLWLSLSIAASWILSKHYRAKYAHWLFPTPSFAVHPAQFLGNPQISQGPLGSYGINIAPMVISWGLRYAHAYVERWTGLALAKAQRAQQKKEREWETPDQRAARKAAKKEAKRQAKQQAQERQEAQAQAAAAMLQQQHRTVEFIPTTQDGTATVNAPPTAASAPMPPPSQAHDEFLQQNQQHSQESDESLFSSPLDELD